MPFFLITKRMTHPTNMYIRSAIALLAFYTATCQGTVTQNYTDDQLWKRQTSTEDITMCPLEYGNTKLGNIFTHFYGVTTDSWTVMSGGNHIPGSVAVGNNFVLSSGVDAMIAPVFSNVDCLSNDIDGVGLVVGNQITASSEGDSVILRNGNAFIGDTISSPASLIMGGPLCHPTEGSIGVMDFDLANSGMATASQYLAELPPDIRMSSTGEITWLMEPSSHPAYHVITLDSCDSLDSGATCMSLTPEQLSDPNGILFSGESWTEPAVPIDEDGRTIVINVPVTSGSTMTVSTTRPSDGLLNCRTIFNFFPVDETGNFIPSGSYPVYFTGNGGYIEGILLFYKGHIEYAMAGSMTIAGKVLAHSMTTGSYVLENFHCPAAMYEGCFPVRDYTTTIEPSSSTDISCEPSTTTTTTTTTTEVTTHISGTITETDVSTMTISHSTTVGTATITVPNPNPTTTNVTVPYTVTTTDTSGVTSTTTTHTTMSTVLVPALNEWPPVDVEDEENKGRKKEDGKKDD